MKKYFYTLLILISSITTLQAQNVKELLSKGNDVFIEVVDKNKNTDGAYESFKRHLLGEEWNRWVLVENKDAANFICRLVIEKKGFNVMSFTSYGARVRTVVEIVTPEGKSIWKSKRQQGNVTLYTGGDALSDAMRKVIRRSLKVELYGEKD
ncbi:MAG: hypothetical protein RSB32_01895 [Mucinivorans sp.]